MILNIEHKNAILLIKIIVTTYLTANVGAYKAIAYSNQLYPPPSKSYGNEPIGQTVAPSQKVLREAFESISAKVTKKAPSPNNLTRGYCGCGKGYLLPPTWFAWGWTADYAPYISVHD